MSEPKREPIWPQGDSRLLARAYLRLAEWYRQQVIPIDDWVLYLCELRIIGLRWRHANRKVVSAECCDPGNIIGIMLDLRRDSVFPRCSQGKETMPLPGGKDSPPWWAVTAPEETE